VLPRLVGVGNAERAVFVYSKVQTFTIILLMTADEVNRLKFKIKLPDHSAGLFN
jgi:hypothetical protein